MHLISNKQIRGSSMVEHSAVNRQVPGSNPGLGVIVLHFIQVDRRLICLIRRNYSKQKET